MENMRLILGAYISAGVLVLITALDVFNFSATLDTLFGVVIPIVLALAATYGVVKSFK